MDIILDWAEKEADIYLNGVKNEKTRLYHFDIETVDAVKIYNLNPNTTSFWKNIEVCNDICPNFSDGLSILFSKMMALLMFVWLLL